MKRIPVPFSCLGIAIFLLLTACGSNADSSTAVVLPATKTSVPSTDTPAPTATGLPPTETPVPPTVTLTPTLAIPAVLEIGSTVIDGDGSVLVYVPEGKFIMGKKEDKKLFFTPEDNALPEHEVILDAFWIDQTEVSNGQYKACVDAGKCPPPMINEAELSSANFGNPKYDNYPVVNVLWENAVSYCSWVNRRLPTEAEWEKAARGTDGRLYPWGNKLPWDMIEKNDILLNYNQSKIDTTTPVDEYKNGASPYGAYNMAGNVSEWVADWFSATYYEISPSRNPLGPDKPDEYHGHVLRGGSYAEGLWTTIATARRMTVPFAQMIGFRCARSE